jgi:hypothetical protein
MVSASVAALGNVLQLFLNLVERNLQEQAKAGTLVAPARIHHTLTQLRAANLWTLVATAVFLVTSIVWSKRRRPTARVRLHGEGAVEPPLRDISPALWVTVFVCIALSFITTFLANGAVHGTLTRDAFIHYRTFRALGNLCRATMWASWVALVWKATNLQARRTATGASGDGAGRPVVGLDW